MGLTEGTQCRRWESGEVHGEYHTGSVGVRGAGHEAADAGRVAVGQDGGVGYAGRVVARDGCIAQFAGCAGDDGAVDGGDLGVGEENEGEDGEDG